MPTPATQRIQTVSIAGSPSPHSRSSWLLEFALTRLRRVGATGSSIRVGELPAVPLLAGEASHPELCQAVAKVLEAELVIVGTPIYKAAYSGLLKVFLDLLPVDALRGKTVLPIATAGSPAHMLAMDYALKPVLSALGARDILDGLFATDRDLAPHDTLGFLPDTQVVARLDRSLQPLIDRVTAGAGAEAVFARCN
jgi:FMN reductase